MKNNEIEGLVVNTLKRIAPELDAADLHPKENLRDSLDIDSFDFLNFIIALNKELGVDIPETDYGKLTTLAEIVDYLSNKND